MKFINFPYKINTIFIMLGYNCNFNCKYCMQHEFKNNNASQIYNPDIINFIKNNVKKNNRINIIFFGGEPLLYFDTIKQIVQDLRKESDKIQYSMITNGSLLNEETISFINEHNISVGISWDGRNTKLSRGIDVFETNKDNIFKLKNGFYISSVLNAYNSPLEVLQDIENLNKEYYKIYNCDLDFNIDKLYFLNNSNSDIFLLDFKKYKEEISYLIDKFINSNEEISYSEYMFINKYINAINNYQEKENLKEYSSCLNGIFVLNLDIQGNLYLCHNNTDKILGNIYSDIHDYIKKYNEYNNILPKYYDDNCNKCSIKYCCPQGCMLLSEDELKNFYCVQNKSLLEPIIIKLIEFTKK